jgi:uncharacterized tellurite resistance protein B-like protein
MTSLNFRRYPRNSPQAAGRILATALLANGDIKPAEWQRLAETQALDRLGLHDLQWHAVMDDLCQDLMRAAQPGQDCLIDEVTLQAWLDEIDKVQLQALVLDLCAEVIEADNEVQPGETLVLRAALERWVLPIEKQQRLEPLIYGLDFQVVPRRGVSIPA